MKGLVHVATEGYVMERSLWKAGRQKGRKLFGGCLNNLRDDELSELRHGSEDW